MNIMRMNLAKLFVGKFVCPSPKITAKKLIVGTFRKV
jgi:hypothetical protein